MWKYIPGYHKYYQVNKSGKIRSVTRTITDKVGHVYTIKSRHIIPEINKNNGYLMVHLCKNGIRKALYVHKIVAEAFIPNEDHLPVVNHKNGNKLDCRASNLEWCTYSENNKYAYDTGLKPKGEGHYKSVLTEKDVKKIRSEGKWGTFQEIANMYGVSGATIRDILLNRTWSDI